MSNLRLEILKNTEAVMKQCEEEKEKRQKEICSFLWERLKKAAIEKGKECSELGYFGERYTIPDSQKFQTFITVEQLFDQKRFEWAEQAYVFNYVMNLRTAFYTDSMGYQSKEPGVLLPNIIEGKGKEILEAYKKAYEEAKKLYERIGKGFAKQDFDGVIDAVQKGKYEVKGVGQIQVVSAGNFTQGCRCNYRHAYIEEMDKLMKAEGFRWRFSKSDGNIWTLYCIV